MSWNSHHVQKQSSGTSSSYITQEFVAHGANVSDLVFGQKSGRVMATGGEDKKVNLWVTCPTTSSTTSKPNCILVSYNQQSTVMLLFSRSALILRRVQYMQRFSLCYLCVKYNIYVCV